MSNKCDRYSRGNRRHGLHGTKVYRAWKHMRERCSNQNCKEFPFYGGRGIKVCKEWDESVERFYQDVGEPPSLQHSLDRYPNNDGDYEPGNVRWATRTQQMRNKRSNRIITAFGQTMTLAEWIEKTGFSKAAIEQRLDRLGWAPEKALSIPVRVFRPRGSAHA